MLYRVFPLLPGAAPTEEGGALFVPRSVQGSSRHDDPGRYGALYASRTPDSAVAERVQGYRGRVLSDAYLTRPDGRPHALATIDDSALRDLVDLDDPRELARRNLRPSRVATGDRIVTQALARALFDEGRPGFSWWSTLEASWINVTLFAERAVPLMAIVREPEVLSVRLPVVRRVADRLGIRLDGGGGPA